MINISPLLHDDIGQKEPSVASQGCEVSQILHDLVARVNWYEPDGRRCGVD